MMPLVLSAVKDPKDPKAVPLLTLDRKREDGCEMSRSVREYTGAARKLTEEMLMVEPLRDELIEIAQTAFDMGVACYEKRAKATAKRRARR